MFLCCGLSIGCIDPPAHVPFNFTADGDIGRDYSGRDAESQDGSDAGGGMVRDAVMTADFAPLINAPGPDPWAFDCRARGTDFDRRSPVPLGCVLDGRCAQPMVVGHRGAGGEFGTMAPENSLSAIRAALVLGLDGVELDVRHTRDDGLVVIHDDTVDRTTMGTGRVAEMTLAAVTALPLLPPRQADGSGDFSCDKVPSLDAALRLTAGKLFVDLDVKTDRLDLIVAAIAGLGLKDEVFISVSNFDRALRARMLDPRVRIQVRPDNLQEFEGMISTLIEFSTPPEIVEIPADQVSLMKELVRTTGGKVFTDVFGFDVTAALFHDLEGYRGLYNDGAHILQSEYPQLVLEALERWAPPRE